MNRRSFFGRQTGSHQGQTPAVKTVLGCVGKGPVEGEVGEAERIHPPAVVARRAASKRLPAPVTTATTN